MVQRKKEELKGSTLDVEAHNIDEIRKRDKINQLMKILNQDKV